MALTRRLCFCLTGVLAVTLGTWPVLAQSVVHVKGRIMSNGRPVEGEIVVVDPAPQLRTTSYRSDSSGAFEFEILTGPGTLLVARADGCVSAERELAPGAREHANVKFDLSPAGSVSGRVLDETGNIVAGAVVRVRYPGERRSYQFGDELGEAVTDGFGRFTLPFVAEDRPFVVEAETTDRLPSASSVLTFERATATELVVLAGQVGQVVRGRVVDAAGAPVGDASIRMRCLPEPGDVSAEERASVSFVSRCNRRATTGPDGAYEFRGVPAVRVIVVASRPGARPVTAEGIAALGDTLTLDLTLR